ncbi:MAG: iron-sulfur cluster assembly accessory protein [Proteobacteria bacterium]|nr:iron-sulfur cluster assembly accessory protein [Pseudomonadota bacterium]
MSDGSNMASATVGVAPRPPIISITEEAAKKAAHLVATRNASRTGDELEAIGIRVGVAKRGCAGLEYVFEFATHADPSDNVVEGQGVKILVNRRDEFYLIGTVLEYAESDEQSGFAFRNPNEKGKCGCGESFYA